MIPDDTAERRIEIVCTHDGKPRPTRAYVRLMQNGRAQLIPNLLKSRSVDWTGQTDTDVLVIVHCRARGCPVRVEALATLARDEGPAGELAALIVANAQGDTVELRDVRQWWHSRVSR